MRQHNGLQAERKYCGNRKDSLITDAAIKNLPNLQVRNRTETHAYRANVFQK